MKEHVANKLLHNAETSNPFYNTMRKSEKSAETSMFLSATFRGTNLPSPEPRKEAVADTGAVKRVCWEKKAY